MIMSPARIVTCASLLVGGWACNDGDGSEAVGDAAVVIDANTSTAGAGMTGGTGGMTVAVDATVDSSGETGRPPPAPTGDFTLGAPVNPAAWDTPTVESAGAPVIVYPSDETRFPRNIYRTVFQWRAAGASQYRLTFDGPGTNVTVYTDGAHPLCAGKAQAACWEADANAWYLIASGNAGKTVTWTVDALDTSTTPATIRRSASITIGFSLQDVPGAIFYWSTTSAGIRRANLSAAEPEDYLTGKPGTRYENPADTVKCVACHVVSRDGRYLAAPVDATSGKSLWIVEVTRAAPPTPLVKSVANTGGHGFATISPDNANVIAAWGGKMWVVDRATGTKKEDLPLGGLQGTQPDWAPDGKSVVFATGKGDSPAGASLAVIPWADDAWGEPTVLLQGASKGAGGSNLFPMFSPDAKWIAFSRGKGGHGDLSAQLWVMASSGGAPIELVRANRVVSNALGDGQTENNQPTWAPPGDLYWVAFNSKREYGLISRGGTQQIWVAAIDPAKLGTGEDPSFPAFHLQFQGLQEDNHRAFWTLDIREENPNRPPPAPVPDASMCIQADKACDPVSDVCCDPALKCDTTDNGVTYTCYREIL